MLNTAGMKVVRRYTLNAFDAVEKDARYCFDSKSSMFSQVRHAKCDSRRAWIGNTQVERGSGNAFELIKLPMRRGAARM
jgi:hypothetical protein